MKSGKKDLRKAIEALSVPFKSIYDVSVVSMKLDAIAATLLSSSHVAKKIGADKVQQLSREGPELPAVLQEIHEEPFLRAAECASDLLAIGRTSVDEFGSVENEVGRANGAREKLYQALVNLPGDGDR
jgi:hypothetical protein